MVFGLIQIAAAFFGVMVPLLSCLAEPVLVLVISQVTLIGVEETSPLRSVVWVALPSDLTMKLKVPFASTMSRRNTASPSSELSGVILVQPQPSSPSQIVVVPLMLPSSQV